MRYTIGIDLGTSSVKAVLFDGENIVKTESASFTLKTCRLEDGSEYVGFSANEYADVVFGVIKNLSTLVKGNVYGIAIASASGNTLLCDEIGNPLIDAYSWTSLGFEDECLEVYGELDSIKCAYVSGWPFFKTFPLAHLAHIKVHQQTLLEKANMVCMTTEFLLYRMTGRWGMDKSTAVPFYLLEQTTGKWHEPYLDAIGITENKLPKVYNIGDYLGNITSNFAKRYNLSENTKVFLGSFDHPSGALANDLVNDGDLLISCGTSWVLFFPHRDRKIIIANNLLCDTFLSQNGGPYGAMVSISQLSYKIDNLLENNFGTGNKIQLFNTYSEKAEKGANGLKINPLVDFEKVFNAHSKENVARAIMEGSANLLKDMLDKLESLGFIFNNVVMAGGPSQSKIWREIIEYTIGKKITYKYGVNNGAVGVAKLASKDI